MAEVRKHQPRSSLIGDQVRAAIGDIPRPITPGSEPQPVLEPDPDPTVERHLDPFFVEVPSASDVRDDDGETGPTGSYTLRSSDRRGVISLGNVDLAALSVTFADQADGED